MELTPEQCRAGRALIGMSQQQLAARAKVGIQTLIAFENGKRRPYDRTVAVIRAALEGAGVAIIEKNGGGPGVRSMTGS